MPLPGYRAHQRLSKEDFVRTVFFLFFQETYIPLVKTLSHVGYGVSEVTLVIAFIILAAFK